MTIDDDEAAIALWTESEGVRLRDADSREGILKSHLMILPENEAAQNFWANQGWAYRSDILFYSFVNGDNSNI